MIKTISLAFLLLSAAPTLALADTATFTVIYGGKAVGHLIADRRDSKTTINHDVKDNGRGPTIAETVVTGADGLPTDWSIKGTTEFGSKVDEHFSQAGGRAEWRDSTGKGKKATQANALYVAQCGSPWSDQIYVHALLKCPAWKCQPYPAEPCGWTRARRFRCKPPAAR